MQQPGKLIKLYGEQRNVSRVAERFIPQALFDNHETHWRKKNKDTITCER